MEKLALLNINKDNKDNKNNILNNNNLIASLS